MYGNSDYAVMFGRAVPGFEPTEEELRGSERAFEVCVEAGIVAPSDPRAVASVLWASVRGVVSLELDGRLKGGGPRVFEEAMRVLADGYLVGERRRKDG